MENKKTSIITLHSEVEIPSGETFKIKGKEYASWGERNVYPEFLLSCYDQCTEHQTIIDGCVNYVMGNGLTIPDQSLATFSEKINKNGDKLSDLLRQLELDYQIFGGFAVKVILNNFKTIAELYYIDMATVRVNEDETKIFVSKTWGQWGTKAEEFKAYDPAKPVTNSIYFYKGKKTRGIYPNTLYNASIKAIQTAIKIDDFHLNNINTNFNASAIINFNNGVPTEEAKDSIEKDIKKKFTGTQADKVLLSFNDSVDTAPTIERLESDNFDQKFESLQKSTKNAIYTAHKVTSPALFGVVIENQGFSKTEFQEAFDIYNTTVIKPLQDDLTREVGKILKPFFNDPTIIINPFQLNTITQ